MSFPRDEFFQDDDEVPRHVLPKTREHTRGVGSNNLNDLERALLRITREKEEGNEDDEEKEEDKRENIKEANWLEFMRRQRALEQERHREKEVIMREILADMNKQRNAISSPVKGRTNLAKKVLSESKNSESSKRESSKHREREKEVEKERTDHHGRKERERIHEQERQRKHYKIINNHLVNELEKQMRGHRQRMVNVGGRVRGQEERFRERERSRMGV